MGVVLRMKKQVHARLAVPYLVASRCDTMPFTEKKKIKYEKKVLK